MKTLTITTKRKAERASLDTLFTPINGKTATRRMRLDTGKYDASKPIVGKAIEVSEDVAAVWAQKQRDKDGAYWALWCYAT